MRIGLRVRLKSKCTSFETNFIVAKELITYQHINISICYFRLFYIHIENEIDTHAFSHFQEGKCLLTYNQQYMYIKNKLFCRWLEFIVRFSLKIRIIYSITKDDFEIQGIYAYLTCFNICRTHCCTTFPINGREDHLMHSFLFLLPGQHCLVH